MGLIVLGIIVIIVAIVGGKSQSPIAKFRGLLIAGGLIVAIIGFASSAIVQINSGTVGVQVLFGEVKETILHEGLRVINPLVEVEEMSIRTSNYTMTSVGGEGQVQGDDAIRVLSKDGLEVKIDLTVLYRVIPSSAPTIFKTIGLNYQDVIIRPVTRSGIRESASYFVAVDLYSVKRDEFAARIVQSIRDTMTNRGFILDQVLIRNIDLPGSVKESIERKITAIQDAERMEFILQKEEREAERKRVEARGVADAQKIVNEGLTPKVLQFEQIKIQKELVNSPNSKIIILGDSKNTPFILGK